MSQFSEKNFFKSFQYARKGFAIAVKSQRNFVRQLICAGLALTAAYFTGFDLLEYCILIVVVSIVLICELFNSVIEFMLDSVFKNKYSKLVEMAKDMAASVVLIASCQALLVGIILFARKIIF